MSVRAVFMIWFLYELKMTSESLETMAFENTSWAIFIRFMLYYFQEIFFLKVFF